MNKLLIIGSSLNYGSPGKICESIGLLAKSNGWEVYMAHGLKYANPSQLITKAVSSSLEERMHTAYSLLFDGHGLASSCGTRKLIDWIEEIKPDVIHLHNLHGYYLNYRILFEYLSKREIPIVWTLHDFWAITGHCAHFDYAGCNKWKAQCEYCPQTRTYPKSLLIDKSERNFNQKKASFTSVNNMTITPVSKWVGNLVAQSFLGKYKIQPIYNGIDLSIFHPVESDISIRMGLQGKFVMLGVASPWYPMKGLYDYYKLSEKLSDDFQIIMVGLSKKQIQDLPKNIIGIERTNSQKELVEYYSMADVTLNLSYQETFGMTTVEGMACGTPGIVYNKTASPELVSPETGIIVEAGDIDGLKKATEEIMKKGKSAYIQACVDRVKENFDKDKCFEKYIELYEGLLKTSI